MNPKVSIIIPVYNVEDSLERCVKSALDQTYQNIEIILVDDGSTDKSGKICDKFGDKYKNIIVIHQQNAGLPSARNIGMKKATGRFFFFLDSDDTIDKDLIQKLIEKTKDDALVGCNIKNIFPKKTKLMNRAGNFEKEDFLKKVISGEMPSFVCGYLFDAKKCRKIEFDEKIRYYEDAPFLVEYLNNIKKIEFIDDSYYNYFQNPNSITLSGGNVVQKLNDLVVATEKTNVATLNKYAVLNSNRKIVIFEAVLQHAKERELREVVEKLELEKYTGSSKSIKLFNKLYQNKNIKGFKRYYKLRKLGKSILMKFM